MTSPELTRPTAGLTKPINHSVFGAFSADTSGRLSLVLAELSIRERLVLSLFYQEGLMLMEIGRVLNMHQSDVGLLHQVLITQPLGEIM